jgi:hypothetical protein
MLMGRPAEVANWKLSSHFAFFSDQLFQPSLCLKNNISAEAAVPIHLLTRQLISKYVEKVDV